MTEIVRYIRRSRILAMLDIENTTLSKWISSGKFPKPTVLNPGSLREVIGWPEQTILDWQASLPQRRATPIQQVPYQRLTGPKGPKPKAKPVVGRPEE